MRNARSESLEQRRLLAFTSVITDRVMTVTGTSGDDHLTVSLIYTIRGTTISALRGVQFVDGSSFATGAAALVDRFVITLGAGNDTLVVDSAFTDDEGLGIGPAPNTTFDAGKLETRPLDVDGGAGNDTISGSPFADTLAGGIGNDELDSGGNGDSISGGDGDDAINLEAGTDFLSQPAFNITTKVPGGATATVLGGAGNDTVTCTGAAEAPRLRVDGGAGNDNVTGSPLADSIRGGADRDYVSAASGDDTVYGDDGNDTVTGGAGRNRLYGGNDKDRLNGSNGRDFLYGEAGDDRLYGNDGNDYLDGGGNSDRVFAGDGDDSLIGGSSVDRLNGEAGNDSFVGGPGNDYLFGGDGTDVDRVPDAGDIVDSVETTG